MKKLLLLILLGGLGGIFYFFYDLYITETTTWRISITNDYINVREDHFATSNAIGQVKKNQTYEVLEFYNEDSKFVWYYIEHDGKNGGWVASSRDLPYVKEINNPVREENVVEEEIDYRSPVIRYYDTIYYASSLDKITYDHLEIEEDSEYDLSHIVYYEAKPKDSETPQWWILYTAVDKFENSGTKLQRIIFDVEPDVSLVELFENR